MTIGLSFFLGLLASSVSYFMLGLWWPVAVVVGLFAWLAFGLLDVKMDSTFTLLGGLLLIFCVSLSAMVFRASDQLSGLQYVDTQAVDGTEFRYPVPLLGNARYGEAIYKANGCAACHTQQVTHESVVLDVKALAGEKNHAAVQEAISRFRNVTGRDASSGAGFPIGEWETVGNALDAADASKARNFLAAAGASVDVQVRFSGEDLTRGWGKRRSVAQDYLFAEPPMLGSVRIGPDLANVGARHSREVLMRILLNPKTVRKNSKMPQHRFLFEKAGKNGEETYKPTKDAVALVDYLLSLKSANYPLPEAPINQPYTSSMPKPAPAPAEAADATKAGDTGK
ncbi:MAG: cbb3-type cytochrome c oxidase subunit II [Verrucomicrobiota bacterium]|jgi:cbb3-type cytochrome oxidase cytochrome c subunit|nr:cbb3-type cytochrome c oxidase subunit II [Verrucomicrobiota bacterium]